MNDIIQIIQTVGFPISACVAMGFYVKYITFKDEVKEALNNNTIALTKLAERLGDNDDCK